MFERARGSILTVPSNLIHLTKLYRFENIGLRQYSVEQMTAMELLMFKRVFDLISFSTGEMDHLPEVAFYMVGPIEEVVKKADRLAEERR